MIFASRQEAGKRLADRLVAEGIGSDVVLGLPRGGVIVADCVATALHCRLDVLVVRKIGHPQFREFAVGALAEADTVVLDENVLKKTRVRPDELEGVIAEETKRLQEYVAKFVSDKRIPLQDRSVILVDDGLATGATTEAAVRSARQQGAKTVTVAIPVASQNGFERLAKISDQVVALVVDSAFEAVGQYYCTFSQTSDEEVMQILARQASDH